MITLVCFLGLNWLRELWPAAFVGAVEEVFNQDNKFLLLWRRRRRRKRRRRGVEPSGGAGGGGAERRRQRSKEVLLAMRRHRRQVWHRRSDTGGVRTSRRHWREVMDSRWQEARCAGLKHRQTGTLFLEYGCNRGETLYCMSSCPHNCYWLEKINNLWSNVSNVII